MWLSCIEGGIFLPGMIIIADSFCLMLTKTGVDTTKRRQLVAFTEVHNNVFAKRTVLFYDGLYLFVGVLRVLLVQVFYFTWIMQVNLNVILHAGVLFVV